ncbi:Uncharacterised protein [Mycobacteroides abscessus]|nr:Uncharacterised protein [Mycobacteroides abscessus]
MLPYSFWSFWTTKSTLAWLLLTSSIFSTRPTRTPAMRTSSPSRNPYTSVKTAEYAVVPPATSRRNVAYTSHVSTIATAMKTTSAINGPRNFIGILPSRARPWCPARPGRAAAVWRS